MSAEFPQSPTDASPQGEAQRIYRPPYGDHVVEKISYFRAAEAAIAASQKWDTRPGQSDTIDDSGLCSQIDTDIFFAEQGQSNRVARWICNRCMVRVGCLEHALSNNITFGFWGGTTHAQREALQRQRRRAQQQAEPLTGEAA